jgi:capsular exopolysaccharide synthesis family protein
VASVWEKEDSIKEPIMPDKSQDSRISPDRQYAIRPYERSLPPSPHVGYAHYEPREEVHLKDYLGVILKKKWIVLSFFISVVVTTIVFTALAVPQYRSTVVLKFYQQSPNVLSFKDIAPSGGSDYFSTQQEILKSRALAERVIRRLHLDKTKAFIPPKGKLDSMVSMITGPIGDAIAGLMPSRSRGESEDTRRRAIAYKPEIPVYLSNSLISRLEITPVKNSELVKVSFRSHDPEIAVSVANAVADEYISYDLDSRINAGREAKEFLALQIENAKSKVEESERLLNDYASQNEIIYLDSGKLSVLTRKLSEISSALSEATTDRMQKESIYRQIKESGSNNPVILNNSLIQGLKNHYATLESEYLNMSRTFTPDYPKMKNLKSQLDSIRSSIELEKSNLIKSVESDYKAALKKEEYLKATMAAQKQNVLDFQGKTPQYETLKREVEINKLLHNNLLQRFNEVGVAAVSKATNIQIVDRALYPGRPYKPDKMRNFLLSIFFGLFGGIAVAFLADYFDDSIKDTDEIEKRMHIPSLGMIPFQTELPQGKRPIMPALDFRSPVAEAFRSISTFIVLSSSVRPPKTILVTSPGEKEGKTTICINIASALAESLGKGIILDADMRRPRLHHVFGLDNRTGLSNCLAGNIEFDGADSALVKPTSFKGLSVITSGPVPLNPSQLLHSTRMKDLIEALHALFNFVIIDAPPLMGMPDSVLLSSMVDGTILVAKAGETPRNAISAAKQIFQNVNGNLLGVVLNGVKKNDLKYGSYSRYYSSYFKN